RQLRNRIDDLVMTPDIKDLVGSVQLTRVLEWIDNPDKLFDTNAAEQRDMLLKKSFQDALIALSEKLGADMAQWQYGQTAYKHAKVTHPLSPALSGEWQKKLNTVSLPRGGYSFTPSANAYGDNNTSGASFRILVDTKDWERTLGINSPGQSGNPESPFYKNLFDIWAGDGYFTVPYEEVNVKNKAFKQEHFKPLK
ncbi:penicillin acylase family protein, partial [Robiginitalea sp.]|nr:penicillin acylase family protein [Robiginitalea sp.]